MPNYSINLTVSAGNYTLARIQKGGTAATGGTDITPPQANGGPVGTTTGWSVLNPGDAVQKALEVISADRSLNGD